MSKTLRYVMLAVGVLMPVAAGAQSAAAEHEVTFARDIAPILQRSCQECHRPASVAPMSLLTYEEVRPWARAIKTRTALRNKRGAMPPWFIEKDIGIQQYKNDPSLTEEEIEKIAVWADNGAPLGNPADLPPPLQFAGEDEWTIGEPDSDHRVARDRGSRLRARQVDVAGDRADRARRGPLRGRPSRSRRSTTSPRTSPATRWAGATCSTT